MRKKVKNKRIKANKPVNIDWLEKRFVRLEKNVGSLIDNRIEELAIITQKGFQQVEERLDKHETVLSDIAHILEGIELRLSQTAYKIDLDIVADRVERMERRMAK